MKYINTVKIDADKIKKLYKGKGLTQKEFVDKIGIHQTTFSRILKRGECSKRDYDAMMAILDGSSAIDCSRKSINLTISDLYASSIKRGIDFLENDQLNPKEIALYISSVVELHKILFPEVNA